MGHGQTLDAVSPVIIEQVPFHPMLPVYTVGREQGAGLRFAPPLALRAPAPCGPAAALFPEYLGEGRRPLTVSTIIEGMDPPFGRQRPLPSHNEARRRIAGNCRGYPKGGSVVASAAMKAPVLSSPGTRAGRCQAGFNEAPAFNAGGLAQVLASASNGTTAAMKPSNEAPGTTQLVGRYMNFTRAEVL